MTIDPEIQALKLRIRALELGVGSLPVPGAAQLVGAAGKPVFVNGWINTGGTMAPLHYWQGTTRSVTIVGRVKTGTLGSVVFVLPTGFRPLTGLQVPTMCGGGVVGYCLVDAAGNVTLGGGNNSDVGLSFTFRTDV